MGHRANLVVLREGRWTLYYDHWCANRLSTELLWGPTLATAFVEQRTPTPGRWLDPVWAEGGCVIDHDASVLLWFGGEDTAYEIVARRATLDLMRRVWDGWQIRWAAGGIAEVGGYVGVDPSTFAAPDDPEPLTAHTSDFEPQQVVVVRDAQGSTAAQLEGYAEAYLRGESGLPELLRLHREASTRWQGDFPEGGATLDLVAKTLSCWGTAPISGFAEQLRRAWPGWTTTDLGDRFEDHRPDVPEAFGLPTPDILARRDVLLDQLTRSCHWPAHNPARAAAQRRDPAARLNPATDETRASSGSPAEKHAILARLRQSVASDPR